MQIFTFETAEEMVEKSGQRRRKTSKKCRDSHTTNLRETKKRGEKSGKWKKKIQHSRFHSTINIIFQKVPAFVQIMWGKIQSFLCSEILKKKKKKNQKVGVRGNRKVGGQRKLDTSCINKRNLYMLSVQDK